MEVERYRTQLLQKRGELLGGPAAKPLQWTMENNSGRQGDMADQASGNNEVHIQLKLKQTDAKILQAIEEALRRIDEGTYGVCRDCGEPIADARLDAIPGPASASPAKKSRRPDVRAPEAADRIRCRPRGAHRAPRSERTHGQQLRLQQYVSVRHQSRRKPICRGCRTRSPNTARPATGRGGCLPAPPAPTRGSKIESGAFREHSRRRRAISRRVRREDGALRSMR
jgi:DnaK suppressor protein